MAAFKNKDNGTWYVQFRYTDWKGERQQKLKRGFATKKEAQAWEREFLMEKQADVNMTFESFVELYEKDIKPKLKLNTWLTKDSIIQKKILPYFKKRKLSEISAKDIIDWQNEIRGLTDCHGKPLSTTYLKTVHNQLSAIFNHAIRYYGLQVNPVQRAGNMGTEERREVLFWTREEYSKFSEAMMDKPISFYAFEVLYHYHLHVVYIPVVEKDVLWTKRCKDPALVGTVKERITQVSMSKKWDSKPALDENGAPILTKNGKAVLKKSYSVLQDDFFQDMRFAGYDDVERGERGSSEEHLTVTQFKVEREQERLADISEQTVQKAQQAAALNKKIAKIQKQQIDVQSVDKIETKPVPLSSKVMMERAEYESLAAAAKKYIMQEKKESKLRKALDAAHNLIAELKAQVAALTKELFEYKSMHNRLNTAGLQQENESLRSKVQRYETVIERNNLWSFFTGHRAKTHTRDDAR